MTPTTVLEVLNKADEYLAQKGCPAARLDAQVLLAHVLRTERVQLYIDYARPLCEEEISAYRRLVSRRAKHEPVAYLVGEKEFWSLPIKVDPRVLIPRPDTETVLEAAGELPAPRVFADVGTGSGCLLCALAGMFPDARGVGVDSDEQALQVAQGNVDRLGLSARVELLRGNLLEPLQEQAVDLICANLPYIPTRTLQELPLYGREPSLALDGGVDGLEVVRRLLKITPEWLAPNGMIMLEIEATQGLSAVSLAYDMFDSAEIHLHQDLAGHDRLVEIML